MTQKNQILLTPGPSAVPQEVLEALRLPMIHHRTKEFQSIIQNVNQNLKKVFCTTSPVLTLASSGTGAMEASIINLFAPGDKVIAAYAGKFGERYRDIAKQYGIQTIDIQNDYGKIIEPSDIKEALEQHPDAKGVLMTLLETSTATTHPIKEIANITRNSKALLLVDAVSGLACDTLNMDEWGVDVVVSGSQKALMLPPGLGFVALGPRAESIIGTSSLPKYYFDLKSALKSYAKDDTPFTPAVSLIRGLDVSLQLILDEGLKNVLERHAEIGSWVRKKVQSLGLKLLSDSPSEAVTAFYSPDGIPSSDIIKLMREDHGVIVANGQAELKGKIIRFAHMGDTARKNVAEFGFEALVDSLSKAGYSASVA